MYTKILSTLSYESYVNGMTFPLNVTTGYSPFTVGLPLELLSHQSLGFFIIKKPGKRVKIYGYAPIEYIFQKNTKLGTKNEATDNAKI